MYPATRFTRLALLAAIVAACAAPARATETPPPDVVSSAGPPVAPRVDVAPLFTPSLEQLVLLQGLDIASMPLELAMESLASAVSLAEAPTTHAAVTTRHSIERSPQLSARPPASSAGRDHVLTAMLHAESRSDYLPNDVRAERSPGDLAMSPLMPTTVDASARRLAPEILRS